MCSKNSDQSKVVGVGENLYLSELGDSIKEYFWNRCSPGTGIDYVLDGNFNSSAENAKMLKKIILQTVQKEQSEVFEL